MLSSSIIFLFHIEMNWTFFLSQFSYEDDCVKSRTNLCLLHGFISMVKYTSLSLTYLGQNFLDDFHILGELRPLKCLLLYMTTNNFSMRNQNLRLLFSSYVRLSSRWQTVTDCRKDPGWVALQFWLETAL